MPKFMSNIVINMASKRISKSDARLAIFAANEPDMVNVVFADTIETQRWIRRGYPKLVGIYDRHNARSFNNPNPPQTISFTEAPDAGT
jgi:hypothetical protein